MHAYPLAEPRRQVTPRRGRPHRPEHRIHTQPITGPALPRKLLPTGKKPPGRAHCASVSARLLRIACGFDPEAERTSNGRPLNADRAWSYNDPPRRSTCFTLPASRTGLCPARLFRALCNSRRFSFPGHHSAACARGAGPEPSGSASDCTHGGVSRGRAAANSSGVWYFGWRVRARLVLSSILRSAMISRASAMRSDQCWFRQVSVTIKRGFHSTFGHRA